MSEQGPSTIKVTVESIKGECPLGNKPGDEFIFEYATPAGVCLGALGALYPAIQTLKYGGSFPWEEDPDVARIGCPDHLNTVVYKLERVKED